MITNEMRDTLQQSCRILQTAETELNRPEEDVMTLSACLSVQNAIKQMLQLYLSAHDIAAGHDASIFDLYRLCVGADRSFTQVDMRNVECKGLGNGCDGKYCLSINHVSNCVSVAEQVKKLVWNEIMQN